MNQIYTGIDVGGGPSGPSIESPFCRRVHICRTLKDRKMGKKREKNKENKEKKRKNRKKNKKKLKKGENCMDLV